MVVKNTEIGWESLTHVIVDLGVVLQSETSRQACLELGMGKHTKSCVDMAY